MRVPFLTVLLLVSGCTLMGSPGRGMVRSELYFGMTRPNGPDLTEVEFDLFMDEAVGPRFPQGYTVLQAQGRWREQTGVTRKEPTRVLVVLHSGSAEDSRKVEAIRSDYKQRFAQEAVMRVDDEEKVAF